MLKFLIIAGFISACQTFLDIIPNQEGTDHNAVLFIRDGKRPFGIIKQK